MIGSTQQLNKFQNDPVVICLEDIDIITAETILNPGVIVDHHLKLTVYVNHVFKVSIYLHRSIAKIRRYLTSEACKSLMHILVTSRIDYCNFLFYGCSQFLIHRLQFIQNCVVRLKVRIPKYSHIISVLNDLH